MMSRTALSKVLFLVTLTLVFSFAGGCATAPVATDASRLAGEVVNVTGEWEGTWSHPQLAGGKITLSLVQDGMKITGKNSVSGGPYPIAPEIRGGKLDGAQLSFHANAPDGPGTVNFSFTVSDGTMTGTICGYTCASAKLAKNK